MKLTHIYSGKVRDIYRTEDDLLLFVASDRISAFDVVMAEPVPDKGRVLSALTVHWADLVADLAPTHLVEVVDTPPEATGLLPTTTSDDLVGRAMVVRRADMLPIECIVRGYITGSAWKEYRAKGTMHGTALPDGLQESQQLPEPIFTPSTKADEGHDENISFEQAAALVGDETAERARDLSLKAYQRAAEWGRDRGIIIADTKFELGFIDGELCICDEILTPDSSRFWPADSWQPGSTPPSLDKQPVRDHLEATGWDKKPPPPPLPADVITQTRARYIEAYERLSGKRFSDWPGAGRPQGRQ